MHNRVICGVERNGRLQIVIPEIVADEHGFHGRNLVQQPPPCAVRVRGQDFAEPKERKNRVLHRKSTPFEWPWHIMARLCHNFMRNPLKWLEIAPCRQRLMRMCRECEGLARGGSDFVFQLNGLDGNQHIQKPVQSLFRVFCEPCPASPKCVDNLHHDHSSLRRRVCDIIHTLV